MTVRYSVEGQDGEYEASDAELKAWQASNPAARVKVVARMGDELPPPGTQSTIGKPAPRTESPRFVTMLKNGQESKVPPGDLEDRLQREGWDPKFSRNEARALSAFNNLTLQVPRLASKDWNKYTQEVRGERPAEYTQGDLASTFALGSRVAAPLEAAAQGAGKLGARVPGFLGRISEPLAKTDSLIGAAARTSGQAGLSGGLAAAAEAPEGERLGAFVEGGVKSAAIAAPLALTTSSLLRDPSALKTSGANTGSSLLPATAPELKGRSPSTWLNPESLKDSAARHRVASLRPSPGMAEDLSKNYGGVEAAGRALNEQTVPGWLPGIKRTTLGSEWLGGKVQGLRERYPWTQKILGTGEVPLLGAVGANEAGQVFDAVREPVGKTIRAMEENGGTVDMGEYFARARGGPGAELDKNWVAGPRPAAQFEGIMRRGEERYLPPGGMAPGGAPAPGTVADLADITNLTRSEARKRAAVPGQSVAPHEATVGTALADASNVGARMKDEAMVKALPPDDFAKYKDLKTLYRTASRGDEATNAFRGAGAAPDSLAPIVYGAAGAEVGTQLMGIPGAIAGRQVGRFAGKATQAAHPGAAWSQSRLAEGIEGQGINPFWQAAGAAARGAQTVPSRAVIAAGSELGRERPDLYPDVPPGDDSALWRALRRAWAGAGNAVTPLTAKE